MFKDTRQLAKATARMVDVMFSGGTPEVNETKTNHNGGRVVPGYLLQPALVDRSNWNHILVESGYHKADED